MKKIILLTILSGVIATSVWAEGPAMQVRKDINSMFFGGRENSQRYVSQGATCEVIVRNDSEANTTIISVADRRELSFIVAEGDANLIQTDEYDAKNGIISILAYSHQTSSLQIERVMENGLVTFRVTISNGIGFPVSCKVY